MALMVVSGCALEPDTGSSTDSLVMTDRCEVTGSGVLATGDVGSGTVRGGDTGAVGTWLNDSTEGTLVAGNPDWILCRINGSTLVDFEGTATLDGTPGYTYRVSIQDRGTPTAATVESLTATRHTRPTRWDDGVLPIATGTARVTIPASLPVTEGESGHGMAVLSFDLADSGDTIDCRYHGNGGASRGGDAYDLRHCTGPGAGSIGAGDTVEVTAMSLRVQNAAARCASPRTTVTVDLVVTHVPTDEPLRDRYQIAVWEPAGGPQLFLHEGVIDSGDFVVTNLAP